MGRRTPFPFDLFLLDLTTPSNRPDSLLLNQELGNKSVSPRSIRYILPLSADIVDLRQLSHKAITSLTLDLTLYYLTRTLD